MIVISRFLKILFILLVITNPYIVLAATTRVIYPAGELENDTRFNDLIEILRTALEKTRAKYGDFECGPSNSFVPKNVP